MLYKKGDKSTPENYRPISLLNTLPKLFTSILFIRLYKWAETNKKLPEWQAGFRSSRSTPEYAIRYETGVERMEITIYKLTSNYIKKILEMPEHRFPRICFDKLKRLREEGIDFLAKNRFFLSF